jgi:hypothetical protein
MTNKSNQQIMQYAQMKTACIKYRQLNRKRITAQNAQKRARQETNLK